MRAVSGEQGPAFQKAPGERRRNGSPEGHSPSRPQTGSGVHLHGAEAKVRAAKATSLGDQLPRLAGIAGLLTILPHSVPPRADREAIGGLLTVHTAFLFNLKVKAPRTLSQPGPEMPVLAR